MNSDKIKNLVKDESAKLVAKGGAFGFVRGLLFSFPLLSLQPRYLPPWREPLAFFWSIWTGIFRPHTDAEHITQPWIVVSRDDGKERSFFGAGEPPQARNCPSELY